MKQQITKEDMATLVYVTAMLSKMPRAGSLRDRLGKAWKAIVTYCKPCAYGHDLKREPDGWQTNPKWDIDNLDPMKSFTRDRAGNYMTKPCKQWRCRRCGAIYAE